MPKKHQHTDICIGSTKAAIEPKPLLRSQRWAQNVALCVLKTCGGHGICKNPLQYRRGVFPGNVRNTFGGDPMDFDCPCRPGEVCFIWNQHLAQGGIPFLSRVILCPTTRQLSQEKLSWTSLNFVCDFDCGQQRRHCEDGSAGHEKTNHTQLMGLQMWWFDFGKPNFWTGFICSWSNAIHVDTMIARKFPKHVVMGFCLGSDRWPPHTCNHIIWSTRGCHH